MVFFFILVSIVFVTHIFHSSPFLQNSSPWPSWMECKESSSSCFMPTDFPHQRKDAVFQSPSSAQQGGSSQEQQKMLVSSHYEEKKKKRKKTAKHPTPAKLEFLISRMAEMVILWEFINTIKANSQEKKMFAWQEFKPFFALFVISVGSSQV